MKSKASKKKRKTGATTTQSIMQGLSEVQLIQSGKVKPNALKDLAKSI